MIITYDHSDLISFGEYLLSKERTERIKNHYEHGDSIPLEDRLSQIYHADTENWRHERMNKQEKRLN